MRGEISGVVGNIGWVRRSRYRILGSAGVWSIITFLTSRVLRTEIVGVDGVDEKGKGRVGKRSTGREAVDDGDVCR